jgi:hypothetical protein
MTSAGFSPLGSFGKIMALTCFASLGLVRLGLAFFYLVLLASGLTRSSSGNSPANFGVQCLSPFA